MLLRVVSAVLIAPTLALLSATCGGDDGPPCPTPPIVTGPTSASGSPSPCPPTETMTPPPTVSPPPTTSPATESPTPAPTVTAPPSAGPAHVIRIGNTGRNTVAFTFDAGSDAGYTAMILDTLAANGITVSFGVSGKWAQRFPDLLERISREGHTFINHSFDHSSFTGFSTGLPPLSQAERWDQLDRTESAVQAVGGTTKPFFRPPYGDYDQSVNEDVGARGYAFNAMWTIDSGGWAALSVPEIIQRCLAGAEPGAIYIFHVGAASQDGPALQSIIDGLRDAGYAIGDINTVLAP